MDVVGLPYSVEEAVCYNDQVVGTTERCTQPDSVGTDQDDPCRQPMPFLCKRDGDLVCTKGYYGTAGAPPCTQCPVGTYSSASNSTACASCATGSDASSDRASCIVTVIVNASYTTNISACNVSSCVSTVSVETSASGSFANDTLTHGPDTASTCPSSLVVLVEFGDAYYEVINSTARRKLQQYKLACCGVEGLEPCSSLTDAMTTLSSYTPHERYAGLVNVASGYYPNDRDVMISRNVTITCPECAHPDPKLHVSDIFILTRCLHSAGNMFTEIFEGEVASSGQDNCDVSTFDNELLECPPGYALVEQDINPGLSRANLCVEYSYGPRKISEIFFLNKTFVNTTGFNCSAPDAPADCGEFVFVEYEELCPEGTEQLAQNVIDGVGNFNKVFMCVRRHGQEILTFINMTYWNQSDALTPKPEFVGDCTEIDFTDVWICVMKEQVPQAVLDPQGIGRVLNIQCSDCSVVVSNVTIQGGNVSQYQSFSEGFNISNSSDIASVCAPESSGGGAYIAGSASVSFTRVIFQNSSARCGGGVTVAGSATATLSNCSFYDNLAFGNQNQSAMGGAVFAREEAKRLAVRPLFEIGMWENPPLLKEMHAESAGPIQDMEKVVRRDSEAGLRVGLANCLFWRNAALSSGGSQRTFGGGVAVSNGQYEVSDCDLRYNTATDGDSISAVGESFFSSCNINDPPVALVAPSDCNVEVGEVRTSLKVTSSNFTQLALRPYTADQLLFTNTYITCSPGSTSICTVNYLNDTGWVNKFTGASARADASRLIAAPHPSINPDIPSTVDNTVPPPSHLYLSNSIAELDLRFSDQDDSERHIAAKLVHSPCLSPSAGAGLLCHVTRFLRLPCCRSDVSALEET
uniref:Tyrosine-protein kinase ephrin type A/B receptor-like domain-containing protein n=1 Tax=Hemiselmis andersenii TaxID=464988 RepID=A0A6U4Z055_HEMAN|mmetsp:Transcript_25814/g.59821  ORF Transcript_25814/g.59821 Transcript_25814/m.59821 type:complete len:864 (+) Transcript_25814:1-2592(+)